MKIKEAMDWITTVEKFFRARPSVSSEIYDGILAYQRQRMVPALFPELPHTHYADNKQQFKLNRELAIGVTQDIVEAVRERLAKGHDGKGHWFQEDEGYKMLRITLLSEQIILSDQVVKSQLHLIAKRTNKRKKPLHSVEASA